MSPLVTIPGPLVMPIGKGGLGLLGDAAREIAAASVSTRDAPAASRTRFTRAHDALSKAAALLECVAWGATQHAIQLDLNGHAQALQGALENRIRANAVERDREPVLSQTTQDAIIEEGRELHEFSEAIHDAISSARNS